MPRIPAPACKHLLAQATKLWPNRRTSSDGIVGDAAHASRVSDHNPGHAGYCHAVDLSHDPAHGVDTVAIAKRLAASHDPRITYIIAHRRIWSPAKGWHAYRGASPHTEHMHVSIADTKHDCESTADFALAAKPKPQPKPKPAPKPRPKPKAAHARIMGDSVRLRSKPSLRGAVIGHFPQGRIVTVLPGSRPLWLHVSYDGKTGYVWRGYTRRVA